MSARTVTLECNFCGEGQVFTDWEDSDEHLSQIIAREEWRDVDGDDCCPDCADKRGLL